MTGDWQSIGVFITCHYSFLFISIDISRFVEHWQLVTATGCMYINSHILSSLLFLLPSPSPFSSVFLLTFLGLMAPHDKQKKESQ